MKTLWPSFNDLDVDNDGFITGILDNLSITNYVLNFTNLFFNSLLKSFRR